VHQTVTVKYYQLKPEDASGVKLTGQSILIASHIRDYIFQLLENDSRIAPFFIESLEKEYWTSYPVVSGEKTVDIRVGGVIDRLDRTEDGLRVIDYKTGRNLKLDFKEWSQLVDRNYYDRRKEIFQTLIYSDILCRTENTQPVYPMIYKLDDLFGDEFVPNVVYQGEKLVFQSLKEEFAVVFSEVLSELFSSDTIFNQTKDSKKCSYCPYNKICRR
jgi:ATP-dependent helicase/DNAse subunit B